MSYDAFIIGGGIALGVLSLEALLYFGRKKDGKKKEALLYKAKQEVRQISQLPLSNPYPLIQISEAGQVIFANPAALDLFPGLKEQGANHPILNGVIGLESRDIAYGDKIYQQNISSTAVNGEETYIIYCYDITDRIRYEKELKRAHGAAEESRVAAEQAKEARGDFLANMSHELRTPMNGIIGLSDILVESGLPGDKQNLIEAVNSSARNLLILLNDILDFSKIEAGELTMEKIPFDVRKVIQQIESLQKPVAFEKGLRMETDIAKNVPTHLVGDPSRLQQILNNLISNAIKFTEQGSITLSAHGEKEGQDKFNIHISVTDTGIGIPKDKQAAVFAKFQQADASTARKYGGTGLGLSITKDLTRLMGGNIAIESEEGQGTTFTVTIPMLIPLLGTYEEVKVHKGQLADGVNLAAKLMIVDDHPINLLFLRQTLTQMGFKGFDEAASGKQALECFEKKSYDLIIMDCQMPEMDGFEATRRIRELEQAHSAPIIIAATANAMKGAEEKCMAAGMDDYISKPIDKDKLHSLLHKWIPGNESALLEQMNAEAEMDFHVMGNASNVVFDFDRLAEFTGGDKEMEGRVIQMFIENLEHDIACLEESLKNKDYQTWNEWAHKLYGACSHVGANALAKVCDEGQTLFEDKAEEIHKIHPLILEQYTSLRSLLKEKRAA